MRDDTPREDQLQTLTLVEDLCDRYGPELSGDELEALANALLKVHGPDEQYPHLPDEDAPTGGPGFVVHSLTDESSPHVREAHGRPSEPPESLPDTMRVQVERLISAANLTGRRRRVAKLCLWGYAPAEIAGLLGLERSVIYREWRSAKRALELALASGDWERDTAPEISSRDARELFRSEQRKRAYRKPGHCARGKEKCRRTGVCPYCGD
jgi:hypothetical protein